MIARVAGVIARRTASGSILQVSGRTSTNTGVAPRREMQPAVAKNENVVVITSSPGPMPSVIRVARIASVPDDTATASPTSSAEASSRSRSATSDPMMNR